MERKASAMYPLGFSRTIISVVMSLNPTIPNIRDGCGALQRHTVLDLVV